ncbi:Lrp/AsnC family transcriptional regulator [Microbispora sp. NPDC046933]|uniref:Lrp/AsnC family transcriptional regulator n=1 Tax=Microbispora sp. NPDC046933 TaxID=3155618 RepID=UPI0033CDE269
MDAVNRQILNLLVLNGRASMTEIASVVSLSVPAVKRRIDRLEKDGIIRGYTAITQEPGPSKMHALVELFLAVDTRHRDAPSIFGERPEVRMAFTAAGESDVIMLVQVDDANHLESLLIDLRRHPAVQRTRALVLLKNLLDRLPA